MNKDIYNKIIKFVLKSGRRIAKRAGKIDDIGVVKKYLTEEDLRIERELKKIIKKDDEACELFAEEENNEFPDVENIWVADPISGTKTFIQGLPHYGIVVAHLKNKVPQFSAIYDPSIDELFTAYKDGGAFLNGKPIKVQQSEGRPKVIYNFSAYWKDDDLGEKMYRELTKYKVYRNFNSFAVNYCHVACGRYDGVVAFTRDAFPEIAGGLIIKEAGGKFKNEREEEIIEPEDRMFVGGNPEIYKKLNEDLKNI